MLENLLLVTILIVALWLGSYAYYLYTSRRQQDLQQEIETVQKLLEQKEKEAA